MNTIKVYNDFKGIYTLQGNNLLWESDNLSGTIFQQTLTRWGKLSHMSGGDDMELVSIHLEGWQVIEKVKSLIKFYKNEEKYYV